MLLLLRVANVMAQSRKVRVTKRINTSHPQFSDRPKVEHSLRLFTDLCETVKPEILLAQDRA